MPARQPLPAISLVAVPGRRRQTFDTAREIERHGFAGIYVPSRFGNMAQCAGLALATERIALGTAIAPIYARTVEDFAQEAAYLHEVWKEAGYADEMAAVEKALSDNRPDDIPKYLTDRWLADNTLFGPATRVREGVEAWRAAGVDTPVLVPNSVAGNQSTALHELVAAFAN